MGLTVFLLVPAPNSKQMIQSDESIKGSLVPEDSTSTVASPLRELDGPIAYPSLSTGVPELIPKTFNVLLGYSKDHVEVGSGYRVSLFLGIVEGSDESWSPIFYLHKVSHLAFEFAGFAYLPTSNASDNLDID